MGEINKQDWLEEELNVRQLIEIMNKKVGILKQQNSNVNSDVLEIKKTFWNDVTINLDEPDDIIETYYSIKQQARLLAERERTQGQIDKQLKTLGKLKYSPYFGRIDFLEEGERKAEKIYIGISSLMDQTDENFLIFDWRAPISSMYYDYSPGPSKYNTPSGTYSGVMDLKRQYIIRNSKLKAMFDTGVTIGDEMLQEVLGNQSDTQMKSIVATIQKEQNKIIRNEKAKLLVVQGVAGSGKTSAALQRVAYLLYRHRDTLHSENIMLFSPNTLFNSYVATVLPELGEENMKQTTFQEYLNNRFSRDFLVEDVYDQMEYLLTAAETPEYETRMESIRYKASNEFKQQIDEYVQNLNSTGMVFKDVIFQRKILISKEAILEHFCALDSTISIPNKMELVKSWLIKELKKSMKKEMTEPWVEDELQYLDKEDYLDVFNELQEKERFSEKSFDDFEREKDLLAEMVVKKRYKRLFNWVKGHKFVNLLEIYKKFFSLKINIDGWSKICKYTLNSLQEGIITYADATPFVYLQNLILGKNSDPSIRHVFIDEAQDYSPFQFSFIQQIFPNSKMTLLGDINQAIYSGVTKSETVLEESKVNSEESETIVLTKTYRSTKPIVEFTRGLIENGEKIEPFNRSGSKPTLSIQNNQWELEKAIINKVKELQENGHKTNAIICKTAKESKMAFNLFKNEIPVRLIEKGTLAFKEGTLIIPAYLAKGIEFDSVIIYDSSQYKRDKERKLFYTACTRAMHELHLFSLDHPSPLMSLIPVETYEILK